MVERKGEIVDLFDGHVNRALNLSAIHRVPLRMMDRTFPPNSAHSSIDGVIK